MTADEYLELDLYWFAWIRKHVDCTVRITEGDSQVGYVGQLLGFSGIYKDGSAILVLKNADNVTVVSSNNIEFI